MALNSLVMMTAGTDEIVMTVDTTLIAGVMIAEVTAMMVNEVTEVIDTGAGTVLSEGGSGAAVMGLMKDTTRMVITLSMITEETQLTRKRARPSCSGVCP